VRRRQLRTFPLSPYISAALSVQYSRTIRIGPTLKGLCFNQLRDWPFKCKKWRYFSVKSCRSFEGKLPCGGSQAATICVSGTSGAEMIARLWSSGFHLSGQGETDAVCEKPAPVPLCAPQITIYWPGIQLWVSGVRGWRLAAWATSRPEDWVKPGLRVYLKTHSVPRSKHSSVLATKTSQLMLYREIIAVCSQIHTNRMNTLRGQNVELSSVKPGGTYSEHWALKG
jgi:hypothetical protein